MKLKAVFFFLNYAFTHGFYLHRTSYLDTARRQAIAASAVDPVVPPNTDDDDGGILRTEGIGSIMHYGNRSPVVPQEDQSQDASIAPLKWTTRIQQCGSALWKRCERPQEIVSIIQYGNGSPVVPQEDRSQDASIAPLKWTTRIQQCGSTLWKRCADAVCHRAQSVAQSIFHSFVPQSKNISTKVSHGDEFETVLCEIFKFFSRIALFVGPFLLLRAVILLPVSLPCFLIDSTIAEGSLQQRLGISYKDYQVFLWYPPLLIYFLWEAWSSMKFFLSNIRLDMSSIDGRRKADDCEYTIAENIGL